MPKEDPSPPALVGRLGLVFAYVCFVVSVVTLSAALYLLPLDLRTKLFLGAGGLLLISMFVGLAVATYLVSRAASRPASPVAKSRPKAEPPASPGGANGSQRPR